MNFLQLKQRLARRRGSNDSALATATETRYSDAINEVHRQLLRKPGMESLRYAQVTFASVANQKLYAVPVQGIARINRITETTNDRKLALQSADWLDRMVPDPTAGTPWAWIPRGYVQVHTQPADASELFVKSTSASDTTQIVYVEGIITGGYARTASVTLTGTTAVSLSASITSFIAVTKFYLSASAAGTVTLHEDSGAGTELGRIAIGDVWAQFYAFQLFQTPASVITYYADVVRSIPDLTHDSDEPLIHEDFHDLLLDKAERKELRKQDDPNRIALLDRDIRLGEDALRSFVSSHPDWRPKWNDGSGYEYSSYGPMFPADKVIV